MKPNKKIFWVGQKTYTEIMEQLRCYKEVQIETRGFPMVSLKGCVKK